MRCAFFGIGFLISVLSGCVYTPVNTATISRTPADTTQFSLAQKAVKACAKYMLDKNVTASEAFQRTGFQVNMETISRRNGSTFSRLEVTAPNPDVIVTINGTNECIVGLKQMTPQQSYNLAQYWVREFDAISNAEAGQGLSDHVIGAWRNFSKTPELHSRTYIHAYKTWPYDREGFPDVPGAAVKLVHVVDFDKSRETKGEIIYTLN